MNALQLELTPLTKGITVFYRKTVVGWYNVYKMDTEQYVTLSPDEFRKLFPGVSSKARYGSNELSLRMARKVFAK